MHTASLPVSPARRGSYDRDRVRTAVASSPEPLRGVGAYVRPGSRVLVKPNLLLSRPTEDGVTTHPASAARSSAPRGRWR